MNVNQAADMRVMWGILQSKIAANDLPFVMALLRNLEPDPRHPEDTPPQTLVNEPAIYSRTFDSHVAPLHYAVIHNKPDIVKAMIDKGLDVNVESFNQAGDVPPITPFGFAAIYGNEAIARMLLDRGAEIPNLNWAEKVIIARKAGKGLAEFLINYGSRFEPEEEENPDSPRPRQAIDEGLREHVRKYIEDRRKAIGQVMVEKRMPQKVIGKKVMEFTGLNGGKRRSRLNKKTRRTKRKRGYTKRR